MKNHMQVWDRHAIKAAVERKGATLTQLAKLHGVSAQTVRNALDTPSKQGEMILSEFLEVPLNELFPARWTEDNQRIYPRYRKCCKEVA